MSAYRGLALALGAFVFTGAVLLTVALWPFGKEAAPGEVRLAPDSPQVVALGAEIYAAQCASCHGAALEGQADWRDRKADGKLPAPPHDETGHTFHHSDGQLFYLTKNGLPKEVAGQPYLTDMPAYGGTLSDAEIIAVLSYIKSRWPDAVRRQHDALNARMSAAQ